MSLLRAFKFGSRKYKSKNAPPPPPSPSLIINFFDHEHLTSTLQIRDGRLVKYVAELVSDNGRGSANQNANGADDDRQTEITMVDAEDEGTYEADDTDPEEDWETDRSASEAEVEEEGGLAEEDRETDGSASDAEVEEGGLAEEEEETHKASTYASRQNSFTGSFLGNSNDTESMDYSSSENDLSNIYDDFFTSPCTNPNQGQNRAMLFGFNKEDEDEVSIYYSASEGCSSDSVSNDECEDDDAGSLYCLADNGEWVSCDEYFATRAQLRLTTPRAVSNSEPPSDSCPQIPPLCFSSLEDHDLAVTIGQALHNIASADQSEEQDLWCGVGAADDHFIMPGGWPSAHRQVQFVA